MKKIKIPIIYENTTNSNLKVYDKVSWHHPEGQSHKRSVLNHFIVIMTWLKDNDLLTKEGKEIFDLGVDSNFSITSAMLTKEGNELMNKYYSNWVKNIDGKTKKEMLEIWNELISD